MKKTQFTVALFLGVLFCIGAAACGESVPDTVRLSAPQNFRIVNNKLIWDSVKNAAGYSVRFYNTQNETDRAYFDLPYILSSEPVTFEVCALGDGVSYSDSEEASFSSAVASTAVTKGLTYTLIPDESGYAVSSGGNVYAGKVFIPDYYQGLPVKKIENRAFVEMGGGSGTLGGLDVILPPQIVANTSTNSVRLPSTLEHIGSEAFTKLVNLTEIVIPEGVTKIEFRAFEYCKSLRTVKLPSTLEFIGANAFASCTNLKTVSLPQSLKTLGIFAFAGTSLTNVTLPEGCNAGLGAFDESVKIN